VKAYIVVEGPREEHFLKRLLPPELLAGVEVVATGDHWGSLTSMARSLVMSRRVPVAMLRDAETISPRLITERRVNTWDVLNLVTAPVPKRLIQAVPSLEAAFFEEPSVLERYFGRPIPEDYVILGKRDPQGVLELLARQSGRPWNLTELLDGLRPDEVERLQSTPVIREVCDFLREAHAFKNGAVSAPSVS
jgi:hypothetical protein